VTGEGRDHWFEDLADHLGSAYLRYSFTKGTGQEVSFLVEELGLEPGMRVLDVGCGPGRHTVALGHRGLLALGVDITPAALAWAVPRGAMVLHRSVFDRLPGTGRWGTVLLLDGNLGIGGDPRALLTRSAELLAPHGLVVAELDPPGTPTAPTTARLEVAGAPGPWFAWDRVPADAVAPLAEAAGLTVRESWRTDGRWFAVLRRGAR